MTTEAVDGAGSHLSIGEVLDELQREFPDVTISKIRFLESQGLIDPERTPSGYRRFYPPDLERLRWILVQQRDHFLPLRVIKERLDAYGPTGAPRLGSTNGGGEPEPTPPAAEAAPPPSPPDSPSAPAPPRPASTSSAPRPAVASAPPAATDAPRSEPGPQGAAPKRAPAAPPTRPARPEPARPLVELGEDLDIEDDSERFGPVRSGRGTPASTDLTRVELLEATGLTDSQLDALESFGIISSADGDDGRPRYDDENLAVAELAAGWYRRGIEARHLKMYSHFAEREAALFAQVLLPYVKQRNPDAKAKLHGELEELARLGRRLRTAMLRRALRQLLGE